MFRQQFSCWLNLLSSSHIEESVSILSVFSFLVLTSMLGQLCWLNYCATKNQLSWHEAIRLASEMGKTEATIPSKSELEQPLPPEREQEVFPPFLRGRVDCSVVIIFPK